MADITSDPGSLNVSAAPLSVVEAFFAALDAFDFERARVLLADQGFSFRSPIAVFDSADQFIQYGAHSSGIVQSKQVRKVFVDGPDVCHFLTYRIQISEKLSVDAAQWSHVENGRILRIQTLFDASIYRELFPGPTLT
ncbi:nuclear transport factor 2 family protein [uncultured Thiodictyon sp.]|uniref:nuclear transport factor 2 family protein n=1 Tax=uncultured Thiodictyon sp. TaxID=1846217 RepID=UPI0025F50D2B|nr:nuclear transport factor 2 family protein [uncultured Thiodictyon sp.]